jgi:hypothetical protein
MNVLVLGARAPIAADLAQALTLHGHRVWLADSLRAPVAGCSPHAIGLIRLPAPRVRFAEFRSALIAQCSALAIDAIVPVSEEVFWLSAMADALPSSVNVRTSPFSMLAALHDKARFAVLATQLGYGAETNVVLTSTADRDALVAPETMVLKPVFSRFAARVLVRPNQSELHRVRPTPTHPWLAQTFIRGRELCAYNVADRGRVLLHVAYAPTFRFGIGASVYFTPIVSEPLRELCERFVAATRFTGQISFDVIEGKDRLVALECNPRGTSGVHLAVQDSARLAAALLGEPMPVGPSVTSRPRMLLLPLLLQHPTLPFTASGRRALGTARDAMIEAGIPPHRQAIALAEMAWRSLRTGLPLSRASTADIEWNGEPLA